MRRAGLQALESVERKEGKSKREQMIIHSLRLFRFHCEAWRHVTTTEQRFEDAEGGQQARAVTRSTLSSYISSSNRQSRSCALQSRMLSVPRCVNFRSTLLIAQFTRRANVSLSQP